MTVSFSDEQLTLIRAAAACLDVKDRGNFLELIASQLKIRDLDVGDATERALRFMQERSVPTCKYDAGCR